MRARRWSTGLLVASTLSLLPTGSFTLDGGAGRLTMRGVTREVAFPVRLTALRDSYLVDGSTTIRMTDFTIPIPRFLIFVAEDPVQVTLKLRFRASDQK